MDKKTRDFWDRIDKAHPELREAAEAQAAANAEKFGPMHNRDEIEGFVRHTYPELRNAREIAIGVLGKAYRIAIVDHFHVNHTLKIKPEEIDQYLATKDRVERMGLDDPKPSPSSDRDKDHERER